MATSKRYCVSVRYKDGTTALYGPARNRTEARKLAERYSTGTNTCTITAWSGPEGNQSGVLRPRTPPPFQPEPEPQPELDPPVINSVVVTP